MTWRCGAPWQGVVLSDTSDEEPPEEEVQSQLLLASDDLLALIIKRHDPSLSRCASRWQAAAQLQDAVLACE
eukprot:1769867-Prymnesium_polylepis.1